MADMHAAVADFTLDRLNSMGIATWQLLFDRCGRSLDQIASGLYDDRGFAIERITANWPGAQFDRCVTMPTCFPTTS